MVNVSRDINQSSSRMWAIIDSFIGKGRHGIVIGSTELLIFQYSYALLVGHTKRHFLKGNNSYCNYINFGS